MLTPIYGVDFSGASDAGRAIWISQAMADDDRLHVDSCQPASALPDSNRDRETAFAALRTLVQRAGNASIGLDFPLSVPSQVMGEQSWDEFVASFADTYPTPRDFQFFAHISTGGRELRRACEVDAKVPFASYNLRLYLQTYHGLRDLVAPLVSAGQAAVLPMQARLPGKAALVEICPASTLKRLGLYVGPPYKGRETSAAERRAAILDALAGLDVVMTEDVRAVALANSGGDALDSLIAAYAVWQAQRSGDLNAEPTAQERVEGRIYF